MKKYFDTSDNIIHIEQTPFQEICVKEHPVHGKILLLDGEVQLTEAHESQYHEMIANEITGYCSNILIVGGGDGYLAKLLAPQGHHVDVAEIDECVVHVAEKYFAGSAFKHENVNLYITDGIEFIRNIPTHMIDEGGYGYIILDVTDQEFDSYLYSESVLSEFHDNLVFEGKLIIQAGCPINNKEMHNILLERVAKNFGNVSMVSEFIECYGEHQSFIIGEVK